MLGTIGWVAETVVFLAHAVTARQSILTYDSDSLLPGGDGFGGDSWVAVGDGLPLPPHQHQEEGEGCTYLDTACSKFMYAGYNHRKNGR
jgi:hypothetical protein